MVVTEFESESDRLRQFFGNSEIRRIYRLINNGSGFNSPHSSVITVHHIAILK